MYMEENTVSEALETIFGLAGGLAIFLFGMNTMSDALQKAAGEKMKQILGILTKNPLLGAIAGALVTAVLQSSSATTVMVIGFVSAGLMTLPQGISVIFGANIGTTMTAQLLAFKISDYIYPIIFIGFIIYFVFKNEKVKSIGMVIFSFGLLFEGIEIMGSVMKPLASAPIFITLMEKVADIPILGVALGAVMTLLVQSSSATIAVLQNFASQAAADGVTSVMGLAGAIPILLGDNIGTTITALLASIGQSKNAKRTAVAHSVFNISGSILFLIILRPFTAFVKWLTAFFTTGTEVEVISRQIANAHTCFNIAVTLIWLPLLPVMVKIVNFIVRGDDAAPGIYKPRFLNTALLAQPSAAIHLAAKEISSCCEETSSMISAAKDVVSQTDTKASSSAFDEHYSAVVNIQEEISHYLTKLFSGGGLTETQSEQAAGLLYVTNNLERISARCSEVTDTMNSLRSSGKSLSEFATQEINEYFDIISKMFCSCIHSVETGDKEEAKAVSSENAKLHRAEKKFRKAHVKRVKNGECDASLTSDFNNILYSLSRIADNCVSVAEEALDDVNFKDLEISDESLIEQAGNEIHDDAGSQGSRKETAGSQGSRKEAAGPKETGKKVQDNAAQNQAEGTDKGTTAKTKQESADGKKKKKKKKNK